MPCPDCSAKPLPDLIDADGRIHACVRCLRGFKKLKETYRGLVSAGLPTQQADHLMVALLKSNPS